MQRLQSGFSIDPLMAEYRALLTSVLHLWSQQHRVAAALEFEDVTRFNEALDEALSASVERYSQVLRQAQDNFIRMPLNAIRIGSETLMRTVTLDARSIRIASRIFNSSARISELVDGMLDLSHARFSMKLNVRPANMRLLAAQVIEEIRAANPDRQITLSVSDELRGRWDTGRLCQILFNLISNVLQHGSPIHPVTVSLDADDASVLRSPF